MGSGLNSARDYPPSFFTRWTGLPLGHFSLGTWVVCASYNSCWSLITERWGLQSPPLWSQAVHWGLWGCVGCQGMGCAHDVSSFLPCLITWCHVLGALARAEQMG